MRRILIVLSMVLPFLCSCNDDLLSVGSKESANVHFSVAVPGTATKTKASTEIGDGKNVDILYYEIWSDSNGKPSGKLTSGSVGRVSEKNFELNLTLLSDQTYHFLLWAQVDGKNVYDVTSLRSITTDYSNTVGNDEDRAAFFAARKYHITGDITDEQIDLMRPFAQLNVGTSTLKSSLQEGDLTVNGTKVTVTSPANAFDVATGVGSVSCTAVADVFTAEGLPSNPDKISVEGVDYHYMSMNYFFVPGDNSSNVTVDLEFYTDYGTVKKSISEVPVAENHKTNIVGDLLFKSAELSIVVIEGFSKEEFIK